VSRHRNPKPSPRNSSSSSGRCAYCWSPHSSAASRFLSSRHGKPRPLRFKALQHPLPPRPPLPAPRQTRPSPTCPRATFRDATTLPATRFIFLPLYEDHTFNRNGKTHPKYGWYLTPEALVIHWGPNEPRYDRIEGPGRYSCPKSIGGRRFMEKQPRDPSDLVKPDSLPVAAEFLLDSFKFP
jgi:hypothetical protein